MSRSRPSGSSSACPGAAHPAVFQVLLRLRLRRGARRARHARRARLGAARPAERRVLQPHDRAARPVADELSDVAARRIEAGEWPWSFFCYPEDRPRPVFPSSFLLLAPGDGSLGLAVRCPACQRISVNLVSHEHVDLPVPQRPEGRSGRARLQRRRRRGRWRNSAPSSTRPRSTPAAWRSSQRGLARLSAARVSPGHRRAR